MKKYLFAIILFSLIFSLNIQEVVHTGKGEELSYIIHYNCHNKSFNVSTESNVMLYLVYADYSYQLIAKAKTNEQGIAYLQLPKAMRYSNGLFVLKMQKQGYKDTEVYFYQDVEQCEPVEQDNNDQTNNEQTEQNSSVSENNQTNVSEEVNNTSNQTNITQQEHSEKENQSVQQTQENNNETKKNNKICFSTYILAMLLFLHIHSGIEHPLQYQ